MPLAEKDRHDLRRAVAYLEKTGWLMRFANLIGQPIDALLNFLPKMISHNLDGVVSSMLSRLLDLAVKSLGWDTAREAASKRYKLASGISGAIGGAFGLPALALELPVSTGIILRAVADIARSEGEDINQIETRLTCLEVFALGGRQVADDGRETGYYAVRAALAKAVSDAAKYIAEKGMSQKSAPVIVRLVAQLTSRFGAVVSEKLAAQAVPIIGAIGGALINLIFTSHFQRVARGHFIVRRLERVYGKQAVKAAYEAIRSNRADGR
jgi:hypothetical protein